MSETSGDYVQVGWFIVGPDGITGSSFRKTCPKWGRAVPAFVKASSLTSPEAQP